MALILTVKLGEDFYLIRDDVTERFVLSEIHSPVECVIKGDKLSVTVVDDKMIPLWPDVLVSIGIRSQHGMTRIVIDAPQSVLILRGEAYRKQEKEDGSA